MHFNICSEFQSIADFWVHLSSYGPCSKILPESIHTSEKVDCITCLAVGVLSQFNRFTGSNACDGLRKGAEVLQQAQRGSLPQGQNLDLVLGIVCLCLCDMWMLSPLLFRKEHLVVSGLVVSLLVGGVGRGSKSLEFIEGRRWLVRICDKLRPFLYATKGGLWKMLVHTGEACNI